MELVINNQDQKKNHKTYEELAAQVEEYKLQEETFKIIIAQIETMYSDMVKSNKETEEVRDRLIKSEFKFRKLIDCLKSKVAVYESVDNGRDFILRDLNEGGEILEKTKKENLINKTITEILSGYGNTSLFNVVHNVWKTGTPRFVPAEQYNKNSKTKNWRENYVFRLSSGEVVVVCDDVTERVNMKKNLIEAKERAEDAARAKSNFLANMSHEIRTPMNAVIGFSNLMNKTNLDDYQKEYLNKISISTKHLLHIINEILDFSKIEAGKMDIESADFNLVEVLENISNIISHKTEEKKLKFILNINSSVPTKFVGDSLKIGQILLNLANNAVKFTDKGEVRIDVLLIGKNADIATMKFSVTDTGIGLKPEELDSLFEAFTQGDASTTRNFGGTGLGLCISKNLANNLGGDIHLESIYGLGSTFSLSLPLKLQTGKSKNNDTSEVRHKEVFSKDELNLIRGSHILLVEDNLINQQLANTILSDEGMIVTIVSNGKEALEFIESQKYDLVLMDLQMPIMGGLEATLEVRKQNRFKNLPIIAMTADAMLSTRHNTKKAGMNGYISKPIDVNQLFFLLVKWIKPKSSKEISLQVSKQAVREADVDFSELQGLDTGIGLRCCGTKRTLYQKMLFSFRREYENYEETTTIALKNKDIEFLQRYIHTLKGIAGTIGAVELSIELEYLNKTLKKTDLKRTEITPLLQKTVNIMNSILRDITVFEKNFSAVEPEKTMPLIAESVQDTKSIVDKLKKNLESYDLESLKSFKQFKKRINYNDYSYLVNELESKIEVFDFESALFALNKIIPKL